MHTTYIGGCHCRRVRYEVDAPRRPTVTQCNCSICAMAGYLAMIVPAGRFRLLQGKQHLTTYRFNTGVARHYFCGHCGIKSFYIPRSHPDGISINVRCLDNPFPDWELMTVDGRDWERQFPEGRADGFPNE